MLPYEIYYGLDGQPLSLGLLQLLLASPQAETILDGRYKKRSGSPSKVCCSTVRSCVLRAFILEHRGQSHKRIAYITTHQTSGTMTQMAALKYISYSYVHWAQLWSDVKTTLNHGSSWTAMKCSFS